jgi:hypothetical protein
MTTLTFHLARALGRGWGPATRSSSPSSITTPTSRRGSARARARRRRAHGAHAPGDGQLDWATSQRRVSGRARASWPSARRRTRSARSPTSPRRPTSRTPPARSCSSTRCTTRRTCWWTSARSAATCWPAPPTSSTARTSACCTAGRRCSSARRAQAGPAPDTAPERLETGTQNHEGIVGAGAAVRVPGLARPGRRPAALATAFCRPARARARLVERLWEGLRGDRGVTLYGPPPARPGRRRCRSRSRGATRPATSPSGWPPGRVRLARRLLRDDGRRAAGPRGLRGWSGPGARATRPRTRSNGWCCQLSALSRQFCLLMTEH